MNKISLIIAIGLILSSCGKYEKFEGEYTTNSNWEVSLAGADTSINNDAGFVVIKEGDSPDELFMYIETSMLTDFIPLGISAKAKIDGNTYTLEEKSLGFITTVNATGTLSDDQKTLTSEVTFSGLVLNGKMSSVGVKR